MRRVSAREAQWAGCRDYARLREGTGGVDGEVRPEAARGAQGRCDECEYGAHLPRSDSNEPYVERSHADCRIDAARNAADFQESDVKAAYSLATTNFGGLDSIILSAGVEPVPSKIIDQSFSAFQKTILVNICGIFLCVQSALPLLHSGTRPIRPSVIILTSHADHGRKRGRAAYATSKAGLSRFIDCLVNEERESAVGVFGIYPSLTRTPLAQGLLERRYDDVMWPEEAEEYKERIESGDVEPPDWCGEACARLAAGKEEGLKGKIANYWEHAPGTRGGKE